ncbi:nucleolar protein 12-domain-containing protein [Talaromyces proteolyticus]|uniref:Nucleolar protein 12-domain-containing protein n=1 Tax=Talaromyces proteolyticus TaxID=1131652 RepID=A0AAD4KXG1_9EURO|nr:nucleolar protein 12-domain-containing protein [Talaromyces proteolyticus]KAH8698301.1 nucleolar protein 12-domain-containing protein [Talaromyces proteolyticus]
MAPQAKRRKIASAVEEINFDPAARQEFLTGFHKRKLQRIKVAQEYAEQKAREEKREERKKIRQQRAAELQQALDTSRQMLDEARGDLSQSESENGSEDEWEGFGEPVPVDHEAEYIDEDKYTTVTVEEMGVSKDAFQDNREHTPTDGDSSHERNDKEKGSSTTKPPKKSSNEKKKKKKFRYESKADRKVTQKKQRMGSRRQAKARREG